MHQTVRLVAVAYHFIQTYSGILDIHGHIIKFLVMSVRVDAYHFSFFLATVTLWNNLPTDVILSPSYSFKNCVAAVCLTALFVYQPPSTEFYSFLFLNCIELITVPPAVFCLQLCTCCLHLFIIDISSSMFLFLFYVFTLCYVLPSVLWHCWLGGRKGIRPVKNWVAGCLCGYLGWGADLHMAQQMPLPLAVSSSKSRLVLPSLFLSFWYFSPG